VNYGQVNQAITRVQILRASLTALSNMSATPSVTVVGADSGLSTVRSLITAIGSLQDKTITITTEYVTIGKPPKFAGGPVVPRQTYQVGELGPELYVSRGGRSEMIGVHGQETRTFPMPGKIIPNHELPSNVINNSSVGLSSSDMREFSSAMAGRTATVTSRRRHNNEYMAPTNATINIGTVNAKSDIDIARAVKRGIADAERDRRERS
jgi:hypothetical protein